MTDQEVVDAFVAHLRSNGFPCLKVDCRPDEVNRETPDIDAIAGCFAIEHTSFDSIPHQRRNDDWFLKVVNGLEDRFRSTIKFRLAICFEYSAVEKGMDWAAVRIALLKWVECESNDLRDGIHQIENPIGVPFGFRVRKDHGRRPGLFFSRTAPDDPDQSERLQQLIERKLTKLCNYHPKYTTVLLVESSDLALMSEHQFVRLVKSAFGYGIPGELSQLWYADTSIPEYPEFVRLIWKI